MHPPPNSSCSWIMTKSHGGDTPMALWWRPKRYTRSQDTIINYASLRNTIVKELKQSSYKKKC